MDGQTTCEFCEVVHRPKAKHHNIIMALMAIRLRLSSLTAITIFVFNRPASSFLLRNIINRIHPFHQPYFPCRVETTSYFSSQHHPLHASATSTKTRTSMTAASTIANNNNNNNNKIVPPIPRRDENRVVYAGVAPSSNWDTKKIPRQSNDSTEKLLDPPVPIPDPYGWMRDDDRTNTEVLQYLHAENEYSMEVTKHLKGLQEELYNDFLSRCVRNISRTNVYIHIYNVVCVLAL